MRSPTGRSLVALALLLQLPHTNAQSFDSYITGEVTTETLTFNIKVKVGEYRKMGTMLGTMMDAWLGEGAEAEATYNSMLDLVEMTPMDEVRVDVVFSTDQLDDLHGFTVPADTKEWFRPTTCIANVCGGFVSMHHMQDMADHHDVVLINPSIIPTTNTGSVKSEGDQAMNSDTARVGSALSGAGLTVGVLSDSFDCSNSGASTNYADDIASGDLPSDVNNLDDLTSGDCSDEGRAMLQIIHDVAPGASLAFHTAFRGVTAFAEGIIALADAGCDVIVDDVGYFPVPYFQDNQVAQAVDTVFARGIPYFSSAGNSARRAWHTDSGFVDSGNTFGAGQLHNFAPAGSPLDVVQDIFLELGERYFIVLQWDQPFASVGSSGSQVDLDFFLVDDGNNVIQESINNNLDADALEFIDYTATYTGRHGLAITLLSGAAPDYMKWQFATGPAPTFVERNVLSSTSYAHQNAAGGAGVGAARFDRTPRFGTDPAVQESFSSAGGTPIFFDTSGNRLTSTVIREQPRFTGPDGGLTTFFGTNNRFFGTSAAAPHVAAVAALMKQADPTLTPTQIYTILQDTANDMDDTATPGFDVGYDTGTGYGFVLADAAIESVLSGLGPDPTPNPTCSLSLCASTPAPTPSPTQSPTPSPVPSPTSGGGTPAPCFSESTIVDVLGKGKTQMIDLQVGDRIFTGVNGYEIVYAFGHRDETRVSEFLEIHSTGSQLPPLEITKEHILLVNNTYVPAKYIQVGDILHGEDGQMRTVTHFHTAYKVGLYAPFTPSGTLLASGIQVSSYVALQKDLPKDWEHGFDKMGLTVTMSQQQVAHILGSPVRVICMGGISSRLCSNDLIDPESGHPPYVRLGLWLVNRFDEGNPMMQFLLILAYFSVCGLSYVLELLVGPDNVPTFIIGAFGVMVAWRRLRGEKKPAQLVSV